jgi:precorrin-3B synthase
MATGRLVTQETLMPAFLEMAHWLAARVTPDRRRMATVIADASLPQAWCVTQALAPAAQPQIGAEQTGALVGAAFGQLDAVALAALIQTQDLSAIRTTPWRMLYLPEGAVPDSPSFVTTPDDPLMRVDACVGMPQCAMASVETRKFARRLAPYIAGRLHVSGCEKGCARKQSAETTLVGRNGAFDIIRAGSVGDTPEICAQSPEDILAGAK